MLNADRFGGAAAAHLVYARGLTFSAGMDAVEARRRDGSWRDVADEWVETLNTVLRRASAAADFERAREFVRGLLSEMSSKGRPDVLTASVPRILPWMVGRPEMHNDIPGFMDSVLSGALAGHAGSLATALDWAAVSDGETWHAALIALAEWLLQNGGAELRRGERGFLVRKIALQGSRAGCGWVGLALQYGLREDTFPQFWTSEADASLWEVVERYVAEESEYLAVEPVLLAGERMHPVPKPLADAAHPRCRDAILGGLLRGEFPRPTLDRLWAHLLRSAIPLPPDALTTSAATLESATHAFHGLLGAPDANATWIEFVTYEVLRVLASTRLSSHRIGRDLVAFGGHTALAPGMLAGVRRYVSAHPVSDQSLLEALLEKGASVSPATSAATVLRLLAQQESATSIEDLSQEMARIQSDLERVLNHPWGRSTYASTFGSLISSARTVSFEDLPDEDKVQLTGRAWRLDQKSIRDCARVARRRGYDRGLKLATLFAIHETLHLHQGIGAKESVDRLRATGAEHTLLQVDLSADHAAAVLASLVHPHWSLAELKGLLGESGFPSSRWHTAAARSRKALRRIGLRLDSHLRHARSDLTAKLGNGYAWADFGPAGGWFLVLSSGPPVTLLASAALSQADAQLLAAAADRASMGPEALAALDNCLERLVAASTLP